MKCDQARNLSPEPRQRFVFVVSVGLVLTVTCGITRWCAQAEHQFFEREERKEN